MADDSEEKQYAMTHKGYLLSILLDYGVGYTDCNSIWDKMRDYCLEQVKAIDPSADAAALVFEGGGSLLGLESVSSDESGGDSVNDNNTKGSLNA